MAADQGLPGKLAAFWPAGDPGRLRAAGDAWRRISATSQDLQAGLHAAIRGLAGANSGRAVERIEAFWERLRAVLQTAADGAGVLARACDDYARYVDDVRGEILTIAAEVVAISVAGLLLTALTVGASDKVAIAADAALIAEATADLGRLAEFAHLVAVPLVETAPLLHSAASSAPAVVVTAAEAESAGDLAALESAHVDALAGVPAHAWPTISGIVRSATQGKGNFGLGSGTRAEAEAAGQAWVGDTPYLASDGKTLVSEDGLRQWRPPSYKPQLGRWQSNFEARLVPTGQWQSNGHLDVTDVP